MLQYSVDFFNRSLENIHHDSVGDIDIDDDYISFQRNTIEVRYTDTNLLNMFVYIRKDDFSYLGVVVNSAPTLENTIQVTFKNFLTVFDEDALFDTNWQLQDTDIDGVTEKTNSKSLEQMLEDLLKSAYVTTSDTLQRLPISVTSTTSTRPWGFNLITDFEGQHYCVVGLYSTLIVNAMKKYGVAIQVTPDFDDKVIRLAIVNQSKRPAINVDGDLKNVTIRTLKVNDRPTGVNKLTVYNTDNYAESVDFYVFTDRSWGVDPNAEGKTRIVPVSREIKSASPDYEISDPSAAFALAAIDVAYGVLSGLEWDNLIELEVAVNDPMLQPLTYKFGQRIALWYKGERYVSILTGKKMSTKGMTLLFGSERIQLTKRSK